MVKRFRALHFVLWTVNFAICIGLVCLMFTTKWFINNSALSFAQSQGDTYWKGFFAECRTDYAVGGYACDNFQFPWFLMDGAVLGCRILFVLGWILMMVALGVNVIIGNWNSTIRGTPSYNTHTLKFAHKTDFKCTTPSQIGVAFLIAEFFNRNWANPEPKSPNQVLIVS